MTHLNYYRRVVERAERRLARLIENEGDEDKITETRTMIAAFTERLGREERRLLDPAAKLE